MIFIFGIFTSVFFFILLSFVRTYYIRNILLFFPVVLYTTLIAFQGESGSDTFEYVRIYNSFTDYNSFPFIEPGFALYFGTLSFFSVDYELVNYSHALVVAISLYLISIKRSPILVALYIIYIGINVDFSTLRQSFGFHIFAIFYLVSNKLYLSAFTSMSFHFSGIFAVLSKFIKIKLTLRTLTILAVILVLTYFVFLQRYLLHGISFLIRDDFWFVFQTLIVLFVCYFMGYSRRVMIMICLFSIIPIGYRIVFFLLLIEQVQFTRIAIKIITCGVILLFLVIKLNSFTIQSINNDGKRSIITHYETLVFN